MIIFGFSKSNKDFGPSETCICGNCHNEVQFRKIKSTNWFTIYFFIKLIPFKSEYLMMCPICNRCTPISKEEFENTYTPKSDAEKYAGKTETQILFLKQMEELNKDN